MERQSGAISDRRAGSERLGFDLLASIAPLGAHRKELTAKSSMILWMKLICDQKLRCRSLLAFMTLMRSLALYCGCSRRLFFAFFFARSHALWALKIARACFSSSFSSLLAVRKATNRRAETLRRCSLIERGNRH